MALPTAYTVTVAFVFGLAVGSFLNVVIYRLPRRIDVARPRSFCPHCGEPIPWYRNIPLLTWLVQRGRCAECAGSIPVRYPLVELATGVVLAAAVWRWGVSWSAVVSAVFACAMLVLAVVDLEFRILPNAITVPGIAAGLLASLVDPRVRFVDAAIGAVVGGGLLYGVAWLYLAARGREGMGMGDVKMIAMVGAFLGWQGALLTVFLGALLGSVAGVAVLAVRRGEWDTELPFGTFLALGAVLVDWAGPQLVDWYWWAGERLAEGIVGLVF